MDQADFLIIIALLLPLVYVYTKTLIIETLFRFYVQAWSENVVKLTLKAFWLCKLRRVWTWTLCLAIFQGNIVAQSIWRPQITTVQQPIDYKTRKKPLSAFRCTCKGFKTNSEHWTSSWPWFFQNISSKNHVNSQFFSPLFRMLMINS